MQTRSVPVALLCRCPHRTARAPAPAHSKPQTLLPLRDRTCPPAAHAPQPPHLAVAVGVKHIEGAFGHECVLAEKELEVIQGQVRPACRHTEIGSRPSLLRAVPVCACAMSNPDIASSGVAVRPCFLSQPHQLICSRWSLASHRCGTMHGCVLLSMPCSRVAPSCDSLAVVGPANVEEQGLAKALDGLQLPQLGLLTHGAVLADQR